MPRLVIDIAGVVSMLKTRLAESSRTQGYQSFSIVATKQAVTNHRINYIYDHPLSELAVL
jgi:hypothetical protein